MIRVVLPQHLRTLARVDGEVAVDVAGPPTLGAVLTALESTYPVLQGTMRDHVTLKRRPFVRFYACEQDMSHEGPEVTLPEAVVSGAEPFLVVGAMAGGNGDMSSDALRRRRSDGPHFAQTSVDVDALAEEIFSRYAGEQHIEIDGTPYNATFFHRAYCPDFRVMKLAGRLALAVNQHAVAEQESVDGMEPLRVSIEDIMLAALLHDLGKQHEDCAPFLELLKDTDLRGDASGEAARRKEYLLGIVRDVHCRKGPCMIDRLRDGGRTELHNPFLGTVARRHGDDFDTNCHEKQGCWWAREINIVTIADDFDAMTSEGPERAYKPANFTQQDAVAMLRAGAERGRYDRRLVELFVSEVLASS